MPLPLLCLLVIIYINTHTHYPTRYYTHFTSPIRRYADTLVHRLLADTLSSSRHASAADGDSARAGASAGASASAGGGAAALAAPQSACKGFYLTKDEVGAIAEKCNEKKDASKKAQEQSDYVYLCVYLKDHPVEADAVVVSTGENAFTVNILSYVRSLARSP